MSNQWKCPINNDEIWYEKVVQKIAPPGPSHSGRRNGVILIFYVNIYNININVNIFW